MQPGTPPLTSDQIAMIEDKRQQALARKHQGAERVQTPTGAEGVQDQKTTEEAPQLGLDEAQQHQDKEACPKEEEGAEPKQQAAMHTQTTPTTGRVAAPPAVTRILLEMRFHPSHPEQGQGARAPPEQP